MALFADAVGSVELLDFLKSFSEFYNKLKDNQKSALQSADYISGIKPARNRNISGLNIEPIMKLIRELHNSTVFEAVKVASNSGCEALVNLLTQRIAVDIKNMSTEEISREYNTSSCSSKTSRENSALGY